MLENSHHKNAPLLLETDILVVGGGSAGCLAAMSAGQQGKHSVLLIERYGFLGGSSTQMLDTFYGFYTPGESPRQVVAALPGKVVDALDASGDVFLRPNTYGAGTGVNYNPERLKWVWDQLLDQAGVKVALHSSLVAVEKMGEGGIECAVWHKSGFHRIKARRVVDASGDADFCHLAGFDYEKAGEQEAAQSMTTTFRMSNVDLDRFERAGGKNMLREKMVQAVEQGRHPLPRKEGSAHAMCQTGCISTVAVKVGNLDPLNVFEMSLAEREGRRQAFIFEKFFQQDVPGYEGASIIGLSHQIGVRETRRVYGEARLGREDCLGGQVPGNSIFLCGAPIEDHRQGANGEDETYWQYIPGNGVYGVPYPTTVPQGSEQVWVAGRCFSASHEAHASCRSMAQTMAMGQAVGLAAVQSLQLGESARDLDVERLRGSLVESGAVLELPGQYADTSRDGWGKSMA
jgi:hypothetical protein